MTNHTKLGAHVLRTATDLGDYVAAKPAIVKLVGDWGFGRNAPEGVLVIGRKHQADYDAQHQRKQGMTPANAAVMFIEDQLPTYQANLHITYWEGHNEPIWNTLDEMAWYAQFEIERMKLMADRGLRCVIGNFATGTPDLALWSAFLSALQVATQYEAILGLHEYSCPWMWWMTGRFQVDPSADEGDEGWTTLRYRKVYRQHLIPNGLGDVPLVITECGIDPLVSPQPDGCPGGTWRQLGSFWAEHDDEPDKADYYFRQLVWYDRELQKDDYVVGATIFCWGSFGQPWADFDVAGTDVSKKLVTYTRENPAKDFSYASGRRGEPRIQYERTYLLLPPDAGAGWARAAVEATWDEHRYTIGGSADDAGIGDLDVRNVIAVNPDQWNGDLAAFFEEHYAGVELVVVEATTLEELVQKLRDLAGVGH